MEINELFQKNIERTKRWHNGNIDEWSPLEWAGAMCGEAGEAANAAKKLKRLESGIASIKTEDIKGEVVKRHDDLRLASLAVAKEAADTIIYALILMHEVGFDDPSEVLQFVFNKKSEEFGFPERI